MIKLSESIRMKVYDPGVGNGSFRVTHSVLGTEETGDLEPIKMRNFSASNYKSNRVKRKPFPSERQKLFTNCVSVREGLMQKHRYNSVKHR